MATKNLVDISKLQEATIIYDKMLRALPFQSLMEVAAMLKLNVMDLAGKHSRINERRRAGGTQSYKIGKDFSELANILGYEPSIIEPKDVVFVTKENAQKYDDNELLIIGGQPVSNITKKHPMEVRIAFAMVRSHMEDVLYSLFSAERDEDSTAPSGAFDGFDTKIDKLILANEVNAARGNFAVSGEFLMPTDGNDTSAYENLVDWIGGAHNLLRSSKTGIPQLLCAETVIKAARAALRNKLKMQEYPTVQRMLELIREDAMCPGLELATTEAIGMGSRLTLQKVGNFDLAFNSQAAAKFCQIRDIYPDPNEWQFWLQCGYDTRVNDWHEKVFRTNEQKNTPLDLAGDYCNTGGVQVNLTGAEGSWSIAGKNAVRTNGQYIIGLAPGEYTINFSAVEGKTAPVSQKVTVTAGQVATATGAYT